MRFSRRRRPRPFRFVALVLSLLAMIAVALTARPAVSQTAGTTYLLSSPALWPTTGSVSATTALALDPSAVFLNPAGLAVQGAQLDLLYWPDRHGSPRASHHRPSSAGRSAF